MELPGVGPGGREGSQGKLEQTPALSRGQSAGSSQVTGRS